MKHMKNRKKYIVGVGMLLLCGLLGCVGCGADQPKQMEDKKQEGITAMQSGDYKGAVESFDAALSHSGATVNEKVVDICFYKAAALYAGGEMKDAIEVYTSIVNYDENDPRPVFLRGSVYLNEGEKEKALEDYREALERSDKDYDLYLLVGENLSAVGMEEESNEIWDEALALEGSTGADFLGKGRIYLEQKNYKEAIEYLEKAVEKKTKGAKVYLAQAYEISGDSDAASKLLAEYVKEDKPSPDALALLGNMEMKSGNYEEALNYYRQGMKKAEGTVLQDLCKGEIAALEYLGEFSEAKEKMTSYISQYPTDQAAIREQIFLQTR